MMKQKHFSFLFIALVVVVFSLTFFSRSEANDSPLDQAEIVKNALQRANFSSDDLVSEPEVKYLIFADQSTIISPLARDVKAIDFFPLDGTVGKIQVIFKAPAYTVTDGKKTYKLTSFKNSVGGILAENGIELAKEDIVDPPADSQPVKDQIKITRVSVSELEKFETIPFSSKEIKDNTLEKGITKVESAGKDGKKKMVYQIRREDGVEVSRTLIKTEIVDQPVNKVTRIGTKVVVLSSISGKSFMATNHFTAMTRYKRGTKIRVTNRANGKTVEGVVKDHGPEDYTGGIMDLDIDLYKQIATSKDMTQGSMDVLVEELKN